MVQITPEMQYAKVHMTRYCTKCGRALIIVPAGGPLFHSERDKCDCGWGCCWATRPANTQHEAHLEYRPATPEELTDPNIRWVKW